MKDPTHLETAFFQVLCEIHEQLMGYSMFTIGSRQGCTCNVCKRSARDIPSIQHTSECVQKRSYDVMQVYVQAVSDRHEKTDP